MGLVANYLFKYIDKKISSCPVKIEQYRCLTSSRCNSLCAVECPAKAIKPGLNEINQDQCFGCGSCVARCPNGAFTLVDLLDETLLRKIKYASAEGKLVSFYCNKFENSPSTQGYSKQHLKIGIKVRCLARLYPGMLLMPLAFGAAQVWLDFSGCKSCPDNRVGVLAARIKANVGEAVRWLAAIGLQGRRAMVLASKPPEKYIAGSVIYEEELTSFDRRSFLKHCQKEITRNTVELTGDFVDQVLKQQEDGEAGFFAGESRLPAARRILLLALNKIATKNTSSKKAAQPVNFPRLTVQKKCSLCNICSKLCPTGAFEQITDEDAGEGKLLYRPASCINCGICRQKCPEKAIEVIEGSGMELKIFMTGKQLDVVKTKLNKCRKCKAFYPESIGMAGHCPICSNKNKLAIS